MAREVNERENVLDGKCRSMPFMVAASTFRCGVFQVGVLEIRTWALAMKEGFMSAAEMWMLEEAVMSVSWRREVVRTRGPHALSRIRRGEGGGGRWGFTREMRCLARRMLQPPVRSL